MSLEESKITSTPVEMLKGTSPSTNTVQENQNVNGGSSKKSKKNKKGNG